MVFIFCLFHLLAIWRTNPTTHHAGKENNGKQEHKDEDEFEK
jgi:hypothetical protein